MVSYMEAPQRCSRSTCCHSSPMRCRFQLWCRLSNMSRHSHFSRDLPAYPYTVEKIVVSACVSRSDVAMPRVSNIPASGGRIPDLTCKSESDESLERTHLEANLAQVAQRPQNSRHAGCPIVRQKLVWRDPRSAFKHADRMEEDAKLRNAQRAM